MVDYRRSITESEMMSMATCELLNYAQGLQVDGSFMHMFFQSHGGIGMVIHPSDHARNEATWDSARKECIRQLRKQGRVIKDDSVNLLLLLL